MSKAKFVSNLRTYVIAGSLISLPIVVGSVARSAEEIVPDEEAGAQIYETVCKGCHGVSIAPTLRGVIGRRIASVSSFAGYSAGLKAKGSLSWSAANIDQFLKAPADFAPGTLMTQTLPEAQQRADLIAFLASLPPPRE